MASRTKTEYPKPEPGIYPGYLRGLTDKQINVEGGTRETIEWLWVYVANGDLTQTTDLSSPIFSDGSKAGKRYMMITGAKAVPDSLDDQDMIGVAGQVAFNLDGKVDYFQPGGEIPDEIHADMGQKETDALPLHELAKMNGPSEKSDREKSAETEFNDIPF